jgi:hypothetical protein
MHTFLSRKGRWKTLQSKVGGNPLMDIVWRPYGNGSGIESRVVAMGITGNPVCILGASIGKASEKVRGFFN